MLTPSQPGQRWWLRVSTPQTAGFALIVVGLVVLAFAVLAFTAGRT